MSEKFPFSESPALIDIEQQLANIKYSHSLLQRMMNLETWAIVSTMDDFFPGFWSRFMVNRQLALKEFLQHKKANLS